MHSLPEHGRHRVVIEDVQPRVDDGRFPIKRVVGETVTVSAAAFADGHEQLRVVAEYRPDGEAQWTPLEMNAAGNDRWRASFQVKTLGGYRFRVLGWVDRFRTWRHDFRRREAPGDIDVALQVGAGLVAEAAGSAPEAARAPLQRYAERLTADRAKGTTAALEEELLMLMDRYGPRPFVTVSEQLGHVVVEPERAGFSSWYEFFPRSVLGTAQEHGDLRSAAERLPYVAEMGFDIVYLPPIHPIGRTKRKGRNNALVAGPADPGSPWAIGAEEGGHKSVHPDLGDLDDFRHFRERAEALGIEVALDVAFQCSPDHPYVADHPQWFAHRPDGSIQYAENPPKRYEDIYPFDFESDQWERLWQELLSVVTFWVEQGVRVFRIDNPHTKPFAFWEWLIGEVKRVHPEVLFLAEAFARPRVLHRLAKLGFSQSYTYFTWRNTKDEIQQYIEELHLGDGAEYLRPNFWPNTPDILPEYLQFGGRAAFMARATLAATLSGCYGVYGPAFELLEDRPRSPGSEEYLDSEKYQVRAWPLERPDSLSAYLGRLNRIRRENPALRQARNVRFLTVDNPELVAYARWSDSGENILLAVVNIDPHHRQSGWLQVPVSDFGVSGGQPYQVHDLISGRHFLWQGESNYVEVDPGSAPAHLFRLRRRVRSEHDFEYFM